MNTIGLSYVSVNGLYMWESSHTRVLRIRVVLKGSACDRIGDTRILQSMHNQTDLSSTDMFHQSVNCLKLIPF